ncbi:glycosyltransferase [Mucilaginibacter conchicola]|uniref:Glycosyltransferase n=1 Tax=Mucilaginibacter conchicola TaxID=2303333 RepID=A0A372NZ96_9SPHI|nr:glycosyltransferase [Mucilaginibacter conchicola]RFZ94847.1 glycosyltransferase [Mucilaginibacter conchicola]
MSNPKVLIINEAFNNHTGGGITLSNLFSGWEKDKIAVICQSYLLNGVDNSICDTYYQLGHKERKFSFPLNLINNKHYSGIIDVDNNNATPAQNEAKPTLRSRLIMNYFYPALKYLGLYHRILSTGISSELSEWLTNYNPDIIYAQAHDSEGVLLVLKIQQHLKKPMVFHMMDDWPAIATGNKLLTRSKRKADEYKFRELLNRSSVLMSISHKMAEVYKVKYQKNFTTFHNPIDLEFWSRFQRNNYDLPKTPTLLYAGRVGLGIDSSLKLVAKAVQKTNTDLKVALRFVIQTKQRPEWIDEFDCVDHKSFVSYEDLPKTFSEADFLILPYDFSEKSLQFIGYSMPTKATEYMISGSPVIVFAPQETALVNYAEKENWAAVVTKNDPSALYNCLATLIKSKEKRVALASRAIEVATKNHSSQAIKSQFNETLRSLIQ